MRKEYSYSHIWTIDVAEAMKAPVAGRQRTKNKEFSVGNASWSPDSKMIAFSATVNPDLIQGRTADIYLLNLADDSVKKLVSQPGPDNNPQWSPDGKHILFSTAMGNERFFASNSRLAVIPVAGGAIRSLTDAFDENPGFVTWNNDGIYFTGLQKTASHLFRLDPQTAKITRITGPDNLMAGGFSLTRDGQRMAFYSKLAGRAERNLYFRCEEFFAARSDQHDRAGQAVHSRHARAYLVEEPGRRNDRRRADQACRLRSFEEVSRCFASYTEARRELIARAASPRTRVITLRTSGPRAAR